MHPMAYLGLFFLGLIVVMCIRDSIRLKAFRQMVHVKEDCVITNVRQDNTGITITVRNVQGQYLSYHGLSSTRMYVGRHLREGDSMGMVP